MSNYRRVYVKGQTYFFTVVTHKRKPILIDKVAICRLRLAFQYTLKKYPFNIKGLVILPDHIHCIWELPENDHNFSIRWNMIKRFYSINFPHQSNHRREKNIWQRRFWEHLIRNEKDYQRCLDYIYYNPVKHGYVTRPCDWLYGTFKRDVQHGLYTMDWGSDDEPLRIKDLEME